MLTQTLRDLERDGLIARQVFATRPPSVEYRLTPLGRSLLEPLTGLVDWAERSHPEIRRARSRFDADAAPADVTVASGRMPESTPGPAPGASRPA